MKSLEKASSPVPRLLRVLSFHVMNSGVAGTRRSRELKKKWERRVRLKGGVHTPCGDRSDAGRAWRRFGHQDGHTTSANRLSSRPAFTQYIDGLFRALRIRIVERGQGAEAGV